MSTIHEKLGILIKTHRKQKSYSTKELASKLNVSAGFINNLENAKNDAFKLEILIQILKELDIPLNQLFLNTYLDSTLMNSGMENNRIEVPLQQRGLNCSPTIQSHIEQIVDLFIEVSYKFDCDDTAMKKIKTHIIEQLNFIKNLKDL
jgi:transcriptional regulator with XRE-family HTH domain